MASSAEGVIEECAMLLRQNILDMQKRQESIPWPPKANNLLSKSSDVPVLLQRLLSFIISGRPFDRHQTKRLDL